MPRLTLTCGCVRGREPTVSPHWEIMGNHHVEKKGWVFPLTLQAKGHCRSGAPQCIGAWLNFFGLHAGSSSRFGVIDWICWNYGGIYHIFRSPFFFSCVFFFPTRKYGFPVKFPEKQSNKTAKQQVGHGMALSNSFSTRG